MARSSTTMSAAVDGFEEPEAKRTEHREGGRDDLAREQLVRVSIVGKTMFPNRPTGIVGVHRSNLVRDAPTRTTPFFAADVRSSPWRGRQRIRIIARSNSMTQNAQKTQKAAENTLPGR
jgi:hypothetical protein